MPGMPFKAYIRGYQSSVSRARKNAAIPLEEAETKAQQLESQYVLSSNPITCQDMQVVYQEQGDKMGRLLTWLSREQSPVSAIARLNDQDELVMDPAAINACFASYKLIVLLQSTILQGGAL